MSETKPRRAKRTPSEIEADLRAKLAEIEKKKVERFRDDVRIAVSTLRTVSETDLGLDCAEIGKKARDMANALNSWLSSKPQEGG